MRMVTLTGVSWSKRQRPADYPANLMLFCLYKDQKELQTTRREKANRCLQIILKWIKMNVWICKFKMQAPHKKNINSSHLKWEDIFILKAKGSFFISLKTKGCYCFYATFFNIHKYKRAGLPCKHYAINKSRNEIEDIQILEKQGEQEHHMTPMLGCCSLLKMLCSVEFCGWKCLPAVNPLKDVDTEGRLSNELCQESANAAPGRTAWEKVRKYVCGRTTQRKQEGK